MSDTVDFKLSWPHQGHEPNEIIKVSPNEAKRLAQAGVGRPATVSAAKAAGTDPGQAATKS